MEPHFVKPNKDGSNNLKYENALPYMSVLDHDDIKVARLRVPKIRGNICEMNIHLLIAEKDKGVKHAIDHQEVGLFDIRKTLDILQDFGIKAEFQDRILEHGMFLGVKI